MGELEAATVQLLADLTVDAASEPVAAGLLGLARRFDAAKSDAAAAAVHREYRQARAELHEHVARRSPVGKPDAAPGRPEGGDAVVVDIVDQLRRPARGR